jgi:beta-glucosidase
MFDIDKLINEMTVTEKALLCSGRSFWYARGIKKYGIKPYMMTDGPHGLRKQANAADNLGINDSVKATCFPVAAVMANTWDIELVAGVGEKIAEEALEER